MQLDHTKIIAALRTVVGEAAEVALHEPEFSGNERHYINECIDSTFVSSVGKFVSRFEEMLTTATGARFAIACVNGTAALQVCLKLVSTGAGDEVLMPALTFVATANAASFLGAVPHFIDSDSRTLGLCPTALQTRLEEIGERRQDGIYNRQTGRRLAAIVAMHTFGHPVDLEKLMRVADAWGIPVVEDAAESLGSLYRSRHTGTFGRVAALSFNGNKIVTTGGGGAILTSDESLARRALHITTTAKTPHPWAFYHDESGYNFRMPNLNAALGCAQLEKLQDFVDRKRRLAESYEAVFENIEGMQFFVEPEGTRSNYWLNTLLIDSDRSNSRDPLLAALHEAGLKARPAWTLMNRLPMYQHAPGMDRPVASDLEQRIVSIPSSAALAQPRVT